MVLACINVHKYAHTQCRTTTNHVKDVPLNVTTAKRSCPVGDLYANVPC